ncbi:putative ATP-dependent RNA helicase DDX59 isoform X3 [Petromyzon marinus]
MFVPRAVKVRRGGPGEAAAAGKRARVAAEEPSRAGAASAGPPGGAAGEKPPCGTTELIPQVRWGSAADRPEHEEQGVVGETVSGRAKILPHTTVPTPETSSSQAEVKHGQSDDEDEAPVVSYSKNQRWPETGEPVCVVCGRYGEYICNETESDVCSLQCKAHHLVLTQAPGASEETPVPDLVEQSGSLDAESGAESHGYRYEEHSFISSLTAEQVRSLRRSLGISVEGRDPPRPVLEFSHCPMPEALAQNLAACGYHEPTPVQMQMLPPALGGRDVIVRAETGSGKTAGFLVPIVALLAGCGPSEVRDPLAVVVTPTRELAMQIERQAKELMAGLPHMRTALLIGGLPLPPQLHRLRQRVQLVIGTPGRVLEVLRRDALRLNSVRIFVIDEVDTMLKLGFREQVLAVREETPEERQSLLVSATLPTATVELAERLTRDPVRIAVAGEGSEVGGQAAPASNVRQIVLWVEEPSKKKKLFEILKDEKLYHPPVVVFVDSKMGADLLADAVETVMGLKAAAMHADKPQTERTSVLQGLLAGEYEVVVSTGVLGRGLDLVNVRLVVNFDLPSTMDEYVHQVGRSGRLGRRGTAISLLNNRDRRLFLDLASRVEATGTQLPAQLLHSPHLHEQRQRRRQQQQKQEQQQQVTADNLMDVIRAHQQASRGKKKKKR